MRNLILLLALSACKELAPLTKVLEPAPIEEEAPVTEEEPPVVSEEPLSNSSEDESVASQSSDSSDSVASESSSSSSSSESSSVAEESSSSSSSSSSVAEPTPRELMTAFEAFQDLGLEAYYINYSTYTRRYYGLGQNINDFDELEIALEPGFTERGQVHVHSSNGTFHIFYFKAALNAGGLNGNMQLMFSSTYTNSAGLVMRGFRWDTDYKASVEVCLWDSLYGITSCKRIEADHG